MGVIWIDSGRFAAVGGPSDPYRNNRSLILHFDGSIVVDTSPRPKTVTVRSTAALTTSFSKFGGSSMNFPGTTAAYLSVSSDTDFQFGTGNFTVEAWLRQTAAVNFSAVFEIGNHLTASGIVFLAGNSSGPYAAYSSSFSAGDGSARTLNVFEHVAWVRDGNSLLIYRNKTILTTRSFTNNLTDNSQVSIGFAPVGGGISGAYVYTGQMDELIVTKGVALQPSEFSFAAPVPDA
jgi:hypothetical protein